MNGERPRDRLGRPLPADADPALVAEPVPGIGGLSDTEVWALALRFIDDGMPFHAHEVFEERWRTATPDERAAWRALAQWGAALTHAARGNDVGARRLAERALDTLSAAPRIPIAIDAEIVRRSCAVLCA
jgi:uncharacterized protein